MQKEVWILDIVLNDKTNLLIITNFTLLLKLKIAWG
jgi:hypothetical protein